MNQAVAQARQSVENKFNNDLCVGYEKQIQEQVEGMIAFDWKQTEILTSQTLQKHPNYLAHAVFLETR